MSDGEDTASLAADLDESALKQDAYEAVKAALDWLAQDRREAEQQGVFPYSDLYTTKYSAGEDEAGYMSSIEGMTALFMFLSEAASGSDMYYTPQIDADILNDDVEWLLDNPDEGGIESNTYRATPYLPKDATTSFTDAVSFTTTTLQESIKIDEIDVPEDRLTAALNRNKEWLLNNSVRAPGDRNGIGWAWCGANEMDQLDYDYPPQRYFTFSATVALVDLYNDDNVDTDDERVEETLSLVLKHLIRDYWTEIGGKGWSEFESQPGGQNLEPHTYSTEIGEVIPSPFSTSNTLFAAAYIYSEMPTSVWEGADLSDADIDRIHSGIDFLIETVVDRLRRGTLESESAEYRTGAKEDSRRYDYVDGSQPYTVLNALLMIDRASGPFEYRDEDLQNLALATVDYILENCWTGDTGFKHFAKDLDDEPVVIYATQLGIEALLWFGIEPPEEGIKPQVMSELESTQETIAELLEDHTQPTADSDGDRSTGDIAAVLRRNEEFTRHLVTVRSRLTEDRFNVQVWDAVDQRITRDVRQFVRKKADKDLAPEMWDINVVEFFSILRECYYATDSDDFRESLAYLKNSYDILLLQPQRETVAELADLDDASIEDHEKRAEILTTIVREFADDPLRGYDGEEVGDEFRERIGNHV